MVKSDNKRASKAAAKNAVARNVASAKEKTKVLKAAKAFKASTNASTANKLAKAKKDSEG